ncbi:N-acetylmuramic acid 6-phosphate etherase [Radicibacter daui]|uniref:N-acetylmuramic acid 6-phosphate etherase n=1 Tax=Radicibacter daui TaxID=3064829 RepID=UPI004046FA86
MRTEDVSPRFADLDLWPTGDLVAALVDAQISAASAVRASQQALTAAADEAAGRLAGEVGRLIYVGAGASIRLGVQDGVELFPTYGWPDPRLLYVVAGGAGALMESVEGAEDDAVEAVRLAGEHALGAEDVVIAIAASGGTPFTVAYARAARAAGALVIGLANNAGAPLFAESDHPVLLQTGAEVVAGSTRMAAGTAQKAALNILSTSIMVRLGRTWSNLMVDLASSNIKLDKRRLAMLRRVVEVDEAAAAAALKEAGGHVKTAALIALGATRNAAAALLARNGGNLRQALADQAGAQSVTTKVSREPRT